MDKLTYLAELAEGLARWVPERERQDILRYYAEYFEEAGPEREAEVIRELGDPWALSSRLAIEGGYVTQEQTEGWTPPKKKKWPWVLAGTLVCVAIIGASVAYAASQLGRFVGGLVGQGQAEETAVVDQVDNAQFGTATEDGVTYVDGAEYAGDSFTGFWNREDGTLADFISIEAAISFGNVTVTAGEDYTLAIQKEGDLGGYEVKWEIKDGTLKVQDVKPGGVEFTNLVGERSLDVIITVPDGFQLAKLNAKIGMGNVFFSGLDAAEKLEAETGMGNVECYEVRAGNGADLKSGMGDVTLAVNEAYSGARFNLKTGMGNVEAQLDSAETDWDYEIKSGLGSVSVNGDSRGTKAKRNGSGFYTLKAESGMGDVELYFKDSKW